MQLADVGGVATGNIGRSGDSRSEVLPCIDSNMEFGGMRLAGFGGVVVGEVEDAWEEELPLCCKGGRIGTFARESINGGLAVEEWPLLSDCISNILYRFRTAKGMAINILIVLSKACFAGLYLEPQLHASMHACLKIQEASIYTPTP
jgi:hypothetical protein